MQWAKDAACRDNLISCVRCLQCALYHQSDHRVDLRVHRRDAIEMRLNDLAGRDRLRPDLRRQRRRVLIKERLRLADLHVGLAKDVGIKSASIHYYFATKGELGGALANRYTSDFAEYLDGLLADGLDPAACLARYTDVFRDTLRNDNRMCLAGIMAAEHKELPGGADRSGEVRYDERELDRARPGNDGRRQSGGGSAASTSDFRCD